MNRFGLDDDYDTAGISKKVLIYFFVIETKAYLSSLSKNESSGWISIPLEQIHKSYLVNWGHALNRGSDSLINMNISNDGFKDKLQILENLQSETPIIRKRKNAALYDDGEYDLNDPFIDDADVGQIFESIHDVFESEINASKSSLNNCLKEERISNADFFVFRGKLRIQVVLKKNKKRNSHSKKIIAPKDKCSRQKHQSKTNTRSKKLASPKNIREDKKETSYEAVNSAQKQISLLDKINDFGKNYEGEILNQAQCEELMDIDKFVMDKSGEYIQEKEVIEQSPSKAKMNTSSVSGREITDLELRLAMITFKKASNTHKNFDSNKFPSFLRSFLNEVTLASLRVEPNHAIIPENVFIQLSSVVPYSSSALKKLVYKKILYLLRNQIKDHTIPSLFQNLVMAVKNMTNSAKTIILNSNNVEISNFGNEEFKSIDESRENATSRMKFSEEFRISIFEIVRCELDLAYVNHAIK